MSLWCSGCIRLVKLCYMVYRVGWRGSNKVDFVDTVRAEFTIALTQHKYIQRKMKRAVMLAFANTDSTN